MRQSHAVFLPYFPEAYRDHLAAVQYTVLAIQAINPPTGMHCHSHEGTNSARTTFQRTRRTPNLMSMCFAGTCSCEGDNRNEGYILFALTSRRGGNACRPEVKKSITPRKRRREQSTVFRIVQPWGPKLVLLTHLSFLRTLLP